MFSGRGGALGGGYGSSRGTPSSRLTPKPSAAAPARRPQQSVAGLAAGPREVAYFAGQKVRHAVFGDGIVVSSKLVENDEEVTVAFSGKGVKRLLASFAKLEKTE
jgi:DNA helicase-2/ATP-dependent DNA helicase PcrA